MSTTVQVMAVAFGVILTAVWAMESLLYRNPRFAPLLLIDPKDFDAVRLWTVNVGWYNLTMAVAIFGGVALAQNDHLPQGEALVVFTAAQHVFLAGVLLVMERRLWLNSVMESALPIAILGLTLA